MTEASSRCDSLPLVQKGKVAEEGIFPTSDSSPTKISQSDNDTLIVESGQTCSGQDKAHQSSEKMKLLVNTMTVISTRVSSPSFSSCCSLANNDMSISLPNLSGCNEQFKYNTVMAGEERNKVNGSVNRASFSGTSGKLPLKTMSLEDCPSCIKHTFNSNGYLKGSGSNPNIIHSSCAKKKELPQMTCDNEEDLPLIINSSNSRLSAVLENISLVYLPHTKQLVTPGQTFTPDITNNNDEHLDMVRSCPEGAENPCKIKDKGVSANSIQKSEPKIGFGPLLALSNLHKQESDPSSCHRNSLSDPGVLSQDSDISTQSHSTVILCDDNESNDTSQVMKSAQDICTETNQCTTTGESIRTTSLSRTDASSFSSISSLSTSTELSVSVASCSDLESGEKVIVDSEEAGFVEINLDPKRVSDTKFVSRNNSQDSGIDEKLHHQLTVCRGSSLNVGAKPKKKSLTSFLTRSLFSRKAKEASADSSPLGWRLFGKIPPKTSPIKDDNLMTDCQSRSVTESYSIKYNDQLKVKRTDIEAPSTTALILEHRPRSE
ncbi:hypothetical protein LSH36_426g02046 [Paralvinella palmiformis]|uniref:Uncharacterized protein n=1 Tax=Paralvinella palmiformis TaxID=53620 RepID=A0AAD9N029_9ANNE|nr:hypothetical protein LSH36_426g02046 [Paralvinella palmiformis]